MAATVTLASQTLPDRSFQPMIEDRAYAIGTGPAVCFDEGHACVHTLDGSYAPFAHLVRRDGYVLRTVTRVDGQTLAGCGVLVIVGPRSRFDEVEETRRWVSGGGSLLVIADRDSRIAVSDLAAAFTVTLSEAVAQPATFRTSDGTLRPHAISRGRHAKESAARVTTFEAQPMRVAATADLLLVAADGVVHGAALQVEKGRAAFFGDTTLFTAQIAGPTRHLVGMNARGAEHNVRFVLNVLHWLSGVI